MIGCLIPTGHLTLLYIRYGTAWSAKQASEDEDVHDLFRGVVVLALCIVRVNGHNSLSVRCNIKLHNYQVKNINLQIYSVTQYN